LRKGADSREVQKGAENKLEVALLLQTHLQCLSAVTVASDHALGKRLLKKQLSLFDLVLEELEALVVLLLDFAALFAIRITGLNVQYHLLESASDCALLVPVDAVELDPVKGRHVLEAVLFG